MGHIDKPHLNVMPEHEEIQDKKQPKSILWNPFFSVSQAEIVSFLVLGICSLTSRSAGNGVRENLVVPI